MAIRPETNINFAVSTKYHQAHVSITAPADNAKLGSTAVGRAQRHDEPYLQRERQ
jgi:hypothetical protein